MADFVDSFWLYGQDGSMYRAHIYRDERTARLQDGTHLETSQIEVWTGFQSCLQSFGLYPKAIPRNLHHLLKRGPAQADCCRNSCEAFFSLSALAIMLRRRALS
jgi:hypothetical protein